MLSSIQSIFIGMFVIGGFGAAGMLSAITASDWEEYVRTLLLCQEDCKALKSPGSIDALVAGIYCYRAGQFLIGTSV
jgi:succinate dehydrogenase/fumarate reductase flavoprotein subunit